MFFLLLSATGRLRRREARARAWKTSRRNLHSLVENKHLSRIMNLYRRKASDSTGISKRVVRHHLWAPRGEIEVLKVARFHATRWIVVCLVKRACNDCRAKATLEDKRK